MRGDRCCWLLPSLLLAVACKSGPHGTPPYRAPVAQTATVDETRAKKEAQLAEAKLAFDLDPSNEDKLIWFGRRLAYLDRFDEAQAVYTGGLESHPASWKILRHRGHRWITLRQFDRALEDLTRAFELCKSAPDEIEPDGRPNAAGIPIGSYDSNIVYHLALAHYLRGEWSQACGVWERGKALNSTNDDRLCSSTYWHQLALRRAGREAPAGELLDVIARPMKILENESYYQLCLLFRGERTPDQLLQGVKPGSTEFATRGYGIACWWRLRGDERMARELLQQIVASGPRNAFGAIAAEVELAR